MTTRKLGVNQQLEQLFHEILDKPQYENKIHAFGSFSLTFNRVEGGGYFISCYELYKFENPYKADKRYTIRNCTVKTFKDILSTDVTGGFLGRFREQFTQYLHKVELREKLQNMPEKQIKRTVKI